MRERVPMMGPTLVEALSFMQRPIACPDDVKARIAALRVPLEDVTGAGGRIHTKWRQSGQPASSAQSGHGHGHSQYTPPARGWGRGSNDGPKGYNSRARVIHPPSGSGSGGGGGGGGGGGIRRPYVDRALAPRFGNKARADVTTEERMMDRIRDKMNKFSLITYDATKTWLSQLLDSGETDFLTDFITLVFEKAAAEQTFCALYARLITELCAGFPHLVAELQRIFSEFMDIFVEAAEEPDVGAAQYKAFVALRGRRRYRRGYAAFIGEVAKLGVLSAANIVQTCTIILDQLLEAKAKEDQGMLCEEYADCLTTLMKSCTVLLRPVVDPLLARVNAAKVKGGCLTNKGRFALMDITDLFK